VDQSTGAANTSFLSVATGSDQVCVAGQVQGTDGSTSVVFSYESIGSISKATDKKVIGEFISVSLMLDITGGTAAYSQEIMLQCKLGASLRKEGSRDKVSLRCELGQNYSAFPNLNSALIVNINRAFAKQPKVKANSKRGRLKISHVGEPADGEVPVSCTLPPT
jgi:hypothetical protein